MSPATPQSGNWAHLARTLISSAFYSSNTLQLWAIDNIQQTNMKKTDTASAEFIPQNIMEKNQTSIFKLIQKKQHLTTISKTSHRHALNSS